MPIFHFDYYLSERKLIQTEKLSLLRDCRVGIEGNVWIRKILKSSIGGVGVAAAAAAAGAGAGAGAGASRRSTSNNNATPTPTPTTNASSGSGSGSIRDIDLVMGNVVGIGGTPPLALLRELVAREVAALKATGIIPFFVFNGLPWKRDKPFSAEDYRPAKRAKAWDDYEQGPIDSWCKSNSIHYSEYMHMIFQILDEAAVEYMRAPYHAWGQLAYMESHPDQLIHCICAGSEMLMWDVERVVLSMDCEGGTFTYLDKSKVLKDLGHLSPETFTDICIMAGFDWIITFPPLNSGTGFSFKSALEMGASGCGVIHSYADHPTVVESRYIDLFFRTKFNLKYHLVWTTEGKVEPLNKETAPNDIHEFFGFKLPDEVYFYMCHGLISPQVLSSLISGYIIENQPLTNTDTLDYTNFIKSPQIAELRVQSASLLSYNTNKFFINRKLSSVYWFDPKVEIPLSLSDTHATCEKWLIESASRVPTVANTTSWVSEAKKKQQFSTNNNSVDVRFCLKTIQALAKVASGGRVDTINPSVLNTPQLPKSDHDILALVIVRFLELRHFTQQSQLITPYGQALLKGLTIPAATTSSSSSSPSSPINSDELILALELLRLEQLSSTPYTVPRVIPKPGDISSDSKEAKHITLISRVVSLVPFLKAAFPPFPGPLSRDLAAFNSFVRTVHRSLRNTMEMLVLSFMVSERPSKKEKDLDVASYVKLAPKLLFFTESGTAMGLVMKSYLTRLVKLEIGGISSATGDAPPMKTSDAVIRAKKATADIYGPASALDFNEQWSRAILFWNQVVEVVKSLNTGSSGKEKEVYDSFLEAEAWFSTRR